MHFVHPEPQQTHGPKILKVQAHTQLTTLPPPSQSHLNGNGMVGCGGFWQLLVGTLLKTPVWSFGGGLELGFVTMY